MDSNNIYILTKSVKNIDLVGPLNNSFEIVGVYSNYQIAKDQITNNIYNLNYEFRINGPYKLDSNISISKNNPKKLPPPLDLNLIDRNIINSPKLDLDFSNKKKKFQFPDFNEKN